MSKTLLNRVPPTLLQGKLMNQKNVPIVLFTLHINPEILRVNEKFNTEILRVKHCVLTTLLGVSNSPG